MEGTVSGKARTSECNRLPWPESWNCGLVRDAAATWCRPYYSNTVAQWVRAQYTAAQPRWPPPACPAHLCMRTGTNAAVVRHECRVECCDVVLHGIQVDQQRWSRDCSEAGVGSCDTRA